MRMDASRVAGERRRERLRGLFRLGGGAASLAGAAVLVLWGSVTPASSQQRPVAPDRAGTGSSAEVWPDQAAPDEEVAREGRGVLPFTQDQIAKLARLLERTKEATARGSGRAVTGRLRRVHIDADSIPVIEVRRGYTTVVGFSDLTGAPWPIEDVLVERRFLPGQDGGPAGHLLYLAPSEPFLTGNLTVKLAGMPDPVVAVLRGGGEVVDFRLDLRLALAGPNVDPAALAKPEAFRAGDDALIGVLTGAVPAGSRRLEVVGGSAGDRAWRSGEDVFLVTRAHVLSPGPWAAERGAAGRWAYRLPETPFVLVSESGREKRLALVEAGGSVDVQGSVPAAGRPEARSGPGGDR